jgi:hypothetical protein
MNEVRIYVMRKDSEIEPENEWINKRRTKCYECIRRVKCNRLVRNMRNWIPKEEEIWKTKNEAGRYCEAERKNGCNKLQNLSQKRRGSSHDNAIP